MTPSLAKSVQKLKSKASNRFYCKKPRKEAKSFKNSLIKIFYDKKEKGNDNDDIPFILPVPFP